MNVLDIIRSLKDNLGVVIHTVACEPVISSYYDFGRDFFQYIAEFTNGEYLPLCDDTLLPEIVIGCVRSQLSIDTLYKRVCNTTTSHRVTYYSVLAWPGGLPFHNTTQSAPKHRCVALTYTFNTTYNPLYCTNALRVSVR